MSLPVCVQTWTLPLGPKSGTSKQAFHRNTRAMFQSAIRAMLCWALSLWLDSPRRPECGPLVHQNHGFKSHSSWAYKPGTCHKSRTLDMCKSSLQEVLLLWSWAGEYKDSAHRPRPPQKFAFSPLSCVHLTRSLPLRLRWWWAFYRMSSWILCLLVTPRELCVQFYTPMRHFEHRPCWPQNQAT